MYFLFWGVITAWGNVFTPVCDSAHMGETLGGLCLRGSLCPGGRGSLSRGWGICPGGLCLGVSVQGVSVQGASVQRVSVRVGLCPAGGGGGMCGWYASYWNPFLF